MQIQMRDRLRVAIKQKAGRGLSNDGIIVFNVEIDRGRSASPGNDFSLDFEY